jgi:hypothetical protein
MRWVCPKIGDTLGLWRIYRQQSIGRYLEYDLSENGPIAMKNFRRDDPRTNEVAATHVGSVGAMSNYNQNDGWWNSI